MSSSRTSRDQAHLAGIFIIALAVLAYQVLLTRIFSVVLYYHFAFVGISLAMLGLTIGAVKVFLGKERFAPDCVDSEWAKAALGFSASSVVLVLCFLYAPLVLKQKLAGLVLVSPILFVIPFTYSGICVTLILTKSQVRTGKLYAADLIGASLGCLGIVGALFYLDPISLIFGLGAMTAFSAWWLVHSSDAPLASRAKILGILWLLACTIQGGLYLTDHGHLGVVWAKYERQDSSNTLYERWNTYSRIRVVPFGADFQGPFGWGYGHHQTKPIPQYFLTIDADAGTVITHFDGDMKPLSYLPNDIINMAYRVRPPASVAVIGVGGGRDILSALYFNAHHVTGIELNPAIFQALTQNFGDFSGHLDRRPDVSLINAEARSWLNQTQQSFDLIQVSLIDTWAATAAGGLTLSENKLYTADAWKDFLDRLTPNGMLSVSRWFDKDHHKGEFYRLLALAVEALERSGVPASEVRQHIFAFNVDKIVTVVVSRSRLTNIDIARTKKAVAKEGFTIMIGPDSKSWDAVSDTIASGKADAAFYNSLPIDVTPTTDDRPFFFYLMRPLNIFSEGTAQTFGESGMSNTAIGVLAFLFVTTTLCMIVSVFYPLYTHSKGISMKGIGPYLGYFAGIGLGFMLIEISQMQRLMVFLGHPVYGLTVILFTLLLFGGIGSMTVTVRDARTLWRGPALLCLVLCAVGIATPAVTEQLKNCGTPARIFASIALIAPAGFFMGMMFPIGMWMSRKYRDLQPWFWGVNGAASVFASVIGVIISMQYGISAAFWVGVACYFVCLAITWRLVKT